MGGGFRFLQTVITEATFIKVAKKRIARLGRIRPLSPSPKCHHRAFGCLFPPSVCWVLGPPFPFVPSPPPRIYWLCSDSPSVSPPPPDRLSYVRKEEFKRERNVKTPFLDTFSLTPPPPPPPPPSPSRSRSSSSSSSPVFKKGAQEKKRNVGNVARPTLESCTCLVPFYRYCLWPPPRPRPRRLPPPRRKSFCGLWRRRRRCCRCCRRRCLPGRDCRRCRRVRRPRGRPRCEVTGKRIKDELFKTSHFLPSSLPLNLEIELNPFSAFFSDSISNWRFPIFFFPYLPVHFFFLPSAPSSPTAQLGRMKEEGMRAERRV